MSDEIKVASLTTFEVAPDGTTLRMGVINSDGNPASVVLPSTCLNRLLMTLPDMMYRSLRARFQDNSLRVVFPAQTWRLERSAPGGQFILTLATFGGFEASFGFDDSGLRDLAGALPIVATMSSTPPLQSIERATARRRQAMHGTPIDAFDRPFPR